jgi:hypothetical protein
MLFHSVHHPFFEKKHGDTGNHENIVITPFLNAFCVGHVANKEEDSDGHDQPEIKHYSIVKLHNSKFNRQN